MADPKPIVLTQTDTNPSSQDPQPFVVVGDIPVDPFDLTAIPGYDAGETQTLKNNAGTIEWETDTP